MKHNIIKTDNYLLVVDGSEVTPLNWCLDTTTNLVFQYYTKREVKTTDKKIIAHLPLNGSLIIAGVDLLPVLEEDSIGWPLIHYINEKHNQDRVVGFCDGYNKAKEKYKYTEEDVIRIVEKSRATGLTAEYLMLTLSQPKMPIGFECEMEYKFPSGREWVQPNPDYLPKTTTTSEGHTQWEGTYIY